MSSICELRVDMSFNYKINPLCGINNLCSRLDEIFGSPEMVEAALKTGLSKFPTLTESNSKRVYELCSL